MSFWRTLLGTISRNPISFFAVLCVAATAVFLGYMTHRMAEVLESSGWCGKAIQAEKISPGSTYVGLTTCVDLLKIQLQAIATGFHISVGSFALTLIVLIVVVVAGAKASGKIMDLLEFNVGKHEAEKAAAHMAEGAKEAEIKASTVPPVIPGYQGPDLADAPFSAAPEEPQWPR